MKEPVDRKQRVLQWGLMQKLEDLAFTDDICLLSHNAAKNKNTRRRSQQIGFKDK